MMKLSEYERSQRVLNFGSYSRDTAELVAILRAVTDYIESNLLDVYDIDSLQLFDGEPGCGIQLVLHGLQDGG
jgi:hypothetical protein